MKPKPKQETERSAVYARGGKGPPNKMAGPQAANPQKPGATAHAVKGGAPGPQRAVGGGKTPRGVSLSTPAKPGRTGVVKDR
jgi:hypothetical protein